MLTIIGYFKRRNTKRFIIYYTRTTSVSLSGCICRQWQRSCAVQFLTSTCQGSLWCYNNHQIRSQFKNDRMKQVCPYYGSIKLETFHECSKLEAVAPSVAVSGPAQPVLVSSAQTRTRLGRGPSQNQSKLSIFLMSVFRQTGLRTSQGNICSIKFSNPDKQTHALSER